MLNPFPTQWLALLAYFILRFFVGGVLLYLGFNHLKYQSELKHILKLSWWPFGTFSAAALILAEIVLSAMFIFGFFTQYAAIALSIMCLEMIILRGIFDHHSIPTRIFYTLLLGCSISLFITGAGVLAFDLPL